MNRSPISALLLSVVFICLCENSMAEVVWDVNNVKSIAGHNTTVFGSPRVIDTDKGKAVWFDGVKDALIVDELPLAGAKKFTLEVILRPDPNAPQGEQKFLHIQENDSKNRIILLVAGSGPDRWYFDPFVKTEKGTQNLWDASKTHPAGRWHNVAIVCDGKQLGQYVNGVFELSGKLELAPFGEGKTAIAAKINQSSWFKGAILKIRFTPRALKPAEFLKP